MGIDVNALTERLHSGWSSLGNTASNNKTAAYVVGTGLGAAALYGAYAYVQRGSYKRSKPTSFQLTGGSIDTGKVKAEWDGYEASYGKEAGQGVLDKSKTTALVDVFYSLVTDLYEWGWGQSFHFSPRLPGKGWKESEAAHEARIAAVLRLKPGQRCLDCGCGVGGPMRTIASVSGADVVGITINQYQVDRATYHNAKQGVSPLASVVRGDFLELPFEEASFDGAYAIEATCHAAKLEDVYAQIYKVLKPGALFVSYEWVTTSKYDAANAGHVKIIDEINFGNGLPEMRTWAEAEAAGKACGFQLVESTDLATASVVSGPWYDRLGQHRTTWFVDQFIVDTLSLLRLAPKGLKQVHKMLVEVADSLVEGGATGIFSPMHMLVFQKPL